MHAQKSRIIFVTKCPLASSIFAYIDVNLYLYGQNEKQMKEEIKFYRSVWRNVLLILCSFAFTAVGVLMLLAENEKPLKVVIAAWIGILFFGLGGLLIAYDIIKEQVTWRPYLIITDEKVVINSWRSWEASFADVETFFLTCVANVWMVGIKYKKNIEKQRLNDANLLGRAVRNYNLKVAGTQDAIATNGVPIKPQALCDLLNERLEEWKQR